MAPSPDLVIRISLVRDEASLRELDPPIWRTFRASSSVNLDLLHDKVLAPVMGWTRNYHTYYFRPVSREGGPDDAPRPDGEEEDPEELKPFEERCVHGVTSCRQVDGQILFGLTGDEYNGGSKSYRDRIHYLQTDTSASDSVHFQNICDEKSIRSPNDVALGDLLKEVGDRAVYNYDLGDCWYHSLVVQEVIAADEANGKVQILDGAMRCPPEDGDGCAQYQKKILDPLLRIRADPRDHELARQHAHTLFDQINFINVMEPFNPEEFDMEERRGALSAALASRNSTRETKKFFSRDLGKMIGFAKLGQVHVITKLEAQMRDRHGNPVPYQTYSEAVNVKPDPPETLCYRCGSPHNLKKAISTYYCGRDCQTTHWNDGWKNQAKKEKRVYQKYCKEKETNTPDPDRFNHDGGLVQQVRWKPGKQRFQVGDFVECMAGPHEYGTGRIVRVGYPDTHDGRTAPYQIKLDRATADRQGVPFSQALIYAQWDVDHQIRRLERGTTAAAKKRSAKKGGKKGCRKK